MKQATCPTAIASDITGQELCPQVLQIQQEHQFFKTSHPSPQPVVAATLVMPYFSQVHLSLSIKYKAKKKKKNLKKPH